MSRRKHHNPEKRSWRGRSHKKGGSRVRALRDAAKERARKRAEEDGSLAGPLW